MRILRGFLSATDLERLLAACQRLERAGAFCRTDRGYLFAPAGAPPALAALAAHARAELPDAPAHDAFFLRYDTGARAAPHVDPPGRRARLIALLRTPAAGGELLISGARADLAPGDAVIFEPSREEHEVTTVEGTRIVWSIGARELTSAGR